ncbi:MAG: NUDIX hydrolase [Bacillota bacterium]
MGYINDLRKLVGTRPIIMVGACVIIIDDKDRILLQLRADNNCWGFAGGSMEAGETLEEVATRELKEETGLVANEIELFQIFSGNDLYYKYPNGDEVYNVVVAFICKNYSGNLKLESNEVKELKFFEVNNLPSNISQPEIPVINAFMESIE